MMIKTDPKDNFEDSFIVDLHLFGQQHGELNDICYKKKKKILKRQVIFFKPVQMCLLVFPEQK